VWPPGLALTLALALPLCGALGIGCGFVGSKVPQVGYASLVLAPLFGAFMSVLTDWAAHKGRVRNRRANWALHVIAGLFGLYLAWCTWAQGTMIRLDSGRAPARVLSFALDPGALFAALQNILELGPWSAFGWTATGWPLAALWGVETILVLVPASAGHPKDLGTYCETCHAWCGDPVTVGRLNAELDDDDVRAQVEAHSWASLQTRAQDPARADSDDPFVRLKLVRCFGCDQLHALLVQRVSVSFDDEGERHESVELIVDRLLLEPRDSVELRASFGSFAAPTLESA
jgi:hypothetical protein